MHIIRALDYGFRGIRIAFREEKIFKIELFGAVLAILLGIYFHFTLVEYCILVLASAAVLATDTLNTAIEDLCDMIQPDQDPRIGRIKDIAGGAVLIVSLAAVAIGCLLFLRHL